MDLHRHNRDAFQAFITQDRDVQNVFAIAERLAPTDLPILIRGEMGTGKELLSHIIHHISQRPGQLWIENVAGLEDTLFTDILVGHRAGAFTGADSDTAGLIKRATGGTLFLDEIGDLSPRSQIALLHVLEGSSYLPLGSDEPEVANTRLIFSTNANLERALIEGTFREDLYFRLCGHELFLPPLRSRPGDIPLIATALIEEMGSSMTPAVTKISEPVIAVLSRYQWPGNVRELKAVVLHGIFSCTDSDEVQLPHIQGFNELIDELINQYYAGTDEHWEVSLPPDELPTLDEGTEQLIDEALRRAEGNQRQAAKLLGITPGALSQRLRRIKGTRRAKSADET
jgi:transcriptional regulator with PAS, ATPase and Fis domain